MDDLKGLIERVSKLLPVSWDNEVDGFGEPTHAVLTFGEHQTQAITMCPDDWMALNEIVPTLRRLSQELEEVREGWRDIATAPDREDGVLVCDANKPDPAVGSARFIDGRWRGYDHGFGVECIYPTPTHWRPLPAPPTPGQSS